MLVETKDGGDGVRCWNVAAIRAYSTSKNTREEQVAAANPDVEVFPGLLRCYGCEVMEYDYGIRCTAELTLTRFGVRDELAPKPADAVASLNQIPTFSSAPRSRSRRWPRHHPRRSRPTPPRSPDFAASSGASSRWVACASAIRPASLGSVAARMQFSRTSARPSSSHHLLGHGECLHVGQSCSSDLVPTAAEVRLVLDRVADLVHRAAALHPTSAVLRESARHQVEELRSDAVTERLRSLPITALKGAAGPGARLTQLEQAGYRTVADLVGTTFGVLDAVPGVGPRTVQQVLAATQEVASRVRLDTVFRFDPDGQPAAQTRLLATVAALHAAESAERSLGPPLQQFADQTAPLVRQATPAGSRVRMFFAGRRTRDTAEQAVAELEAILADPRVASLDHRLRASAAASDRRNYRPEQLWSDYVRDAAAAYARLSTLGDAPRPDDAETATGFIPEELRQKITATPLDQSLLTVTLRGYQVFGAQYAIHQGRSILGDEMGLGKTVQGLAAIAHLAARGQRRFLVVCPASVQINWLKETSKHTRLRAHSLHGPDRDQAAQAWLREGGVAITTFGTLARLPEAVRRADLALLIVDEAHFIKNPETARSQTVAAVAAGAQRTFFLTGTPMENRVEEFRTLVGYLQPRLAARVSTGDAVAGARAFRRAVAPVYLRRNTEDVMMELPEKIEIEDWVQHSMEDDAEYVAAVRAHRLMDMRQAAYRSPTSAKLERLEQIVDEASEDGRKVVIFSFFLHVLDAVSRRLDSQVVGTITGAVSPTRRQEMVDRFTRQPRHAVLLSQIEAGGVGINMQAASIVIITEPQWKPSTEDQAIARAHRMGQVRTVQVHRLLAKDSVDERIREVQVDKALLFAAYAAPSDAKEADRRATDPDWHRPAELDDTSLPLERRVILAEEYRLRDQPVLP